MINQLSDTGCYLCLVMTGLLLSAFFKDVSGQNNTKEAAVVKTLLPNFLALKSRSLNENGQDYGDETQAEKNKKKPNTRLFKPSFKKFIAPSSTKNLNNSKENGQDYSEDSGNKVTRDKNGVFTINLSYPEVKSLHTLVIKEVS